MTAARLGDTVRLHCRGTLGNGAVFDAAEHELVLGAGALPMELERALVGLSPGQARSLDIPRDRAFGLRDPGLVVTLRRDALSPEALGEAGLGEAAALELADGRVLPARIIAISDRSVTLDANHPLAGWDLHYDVRLLGIVEGAQAAR